MKNLFEITGHCHCKKVQYRAQVDASKVRICHCNDCQITSGSAFRVNLPADNSKFQLISGKLKTYVKIADSGNQRALCFCDNCGTQIYSGAVPEGESINLRVGTIEQRQLLLPQSQQWESEALKWCQSILR